jgi:hypothetical protein
MRSDIVTARAAMRMGIWIANAVLQVVDRRHNFIFTAHAKALAANAPDNAIGALQSLKRLFLRHLFHQRAPCSSTLWIRSSSQVHRGPQHE